LVKGEGGGVQNNFAALTRRAGAAKLNNYAHCSKVSPLGSNVDR